MPANGWWHEWTFNYNVKVENNEVHLDVAEHEAKILVWIGENWEPPVPPPVPEDESNHPEELNKNAEESKQPESSSNQNTESASTEVPAQS